ncbi:MAG: hypothetical protein K9K66_06925 [Desulfarculaceae bacterium]|nr:hypothetical protein [Desulfarculaceae bacterium]MCF8071823.1 hypothetical protein [Desulfarculaceae bacterium]MCF8101373.1 hypothetical protein [Desulfarculaceae bacterium]MCF8117166.1 hypothetical protein [Desulfarculaceae bacterium]
MSLLYIVKSEPSQSTETLMKSLGEGKEVKRFDLYENTDYDKLLEDIFAAEEIISWW